MSRLLSGPIVSVKKKWECHEEAISDVLSFLKYRILLTASIDSTIKIWDLDSFVFLNTIEKHNSKTGLVKWDEDSFLSYSDQSIRSWKLLSNFPFFECVNEFLGRNMRNKVRGLLKINTGLFFTASNDRKFYLISYYEFKVMKEIDAFGESNFFVPTECYLHLSKKFEKNLYVFVKYAFETSTLTSNYQILRLNYETNILERKYGISIFYNDFEVTAAEYFVNEKDEEIIIVAVSTDKCTIKFSYMVFNTLKENQIYPPYSYAVVEPTELCGEVTSIKNLQNRYLLSCDKNGNFFINELFFPDEKVMIKQIGTIESHENCLNNLNILRIKSGRSITVASNSDDGRIVLIDIDGLRLVNEKNILEDMKERVDYLIHSNVFLEENDGFVVSTNLLNMKIQRVYKIFLI